MNTQKTEETTTVAACPTLSEGLERIQMEIFEMRGHGWSALVVAPSRKDAVNMFSGREMFSVHSRGLAASGVKDGCYSYSGNVPWRSNYK